MTNESKPLTLDDFIKILDREMRIIRRAFRRLSMPDQFRVMKEVIGKILFFGLTNQRTAEDDISDIIESISRVEDKFVSSFDSSEFRDELRNNSAASQKIDAYYEVLSDGTARIMVDMPSLPYRSTDRLPSLVSDVGGVSEYSNESGGRVILMRDNDTLAHSELFVEKITGPTSTWGITLHASAGKKHGSLTPREYYFLLFHCQSRKAKIDQSMTRGCHINFSVIENMPAGPMKHLQSIPYAWMGDPRDKKYSGNLADHQSKMKSAINKQISTEIIIFEDSHYALNPHLQLDKVHIPSLYLE